MRAMKTKDAIRYLKERSPEEHLVIAWWDNKDFPEIAKEDWPNAASRGTIMNWGDATKALRNEFKLSDSQFLAEMEASFAPKKGWIKSSFDKLFK
jgi:hypothetical protein